MTKQKYRLLALTLFMSTALTVPAAFADPEGTGGPALPPGGATTESSQTQHQTLPDIRKVPVMRPLEPRDSDVQRPDMPDVQRPVMREIQRERGTNNGTSADDQKRNEHYLQADSNRDGFLTKDEMLTQHKKRLDEMFEKSDLNKDGKLSKEELQKGREVMRAKMKDRMSEWRNKRGEHMEGHDQYRRSDPNTSGIEESITKD